VNPTIQKFGYPASLLKEFEHWLVLLRPAQVTLGSIVLAAKSKSKAYGELPGAAFTEQREAVRVIERAMGQFVSCERINYLMLMMVDPNVHFHVIPRYSQPRSWSGFEFIDAGWPGPPRLDTAVKLDDADFQRLLAEIATNFR